MGPPLYLETLDEVSKEDKTMSRKKLTREQQKAMFAKGWKKSIRKEYYPTERREIRYHPENIKDNLIPVLIKLSKNPVRVKTAHKIKTPKGLPILVKDSSGNYVEKEEKSAEAVLKTEDGQIISKAQTPEEAHMDVVDRYIDSVFEKKPVHSSVRIRTFERPYYCKQCHRRTPHEIKKDDYRRKIICQKCNRTRVKWKGE